MFLRMIQGLFGDRTAAGLVIATTGPPGDRSFIIHDMEAAKLEAGQKLRGTSWEPRSPVA